MLVGQSVTALLALGEMVPLATKQFDLSVGFHLGMAQILIIGLQVNSGLPWGGAAAIVLVIAVLVGALNGFLITRLGSIRSSRRWASARCCTASPTGTAAASRSWLPNLPDSFINLTEILWHIPLPAIYVAVAAIVLWLVTERLPVGRSLYVIGASPRRRN